MIRTPPRPVDIAAEFPELAGQERPTVRLYGQPGLRDSSVGGHCCGRPPSRGPAATPPTARFGSLV